ncbi:MAG: hypothetical protein WBA16_09065 [Nonlabens sp.]
MSIVSIALDLGTGFDDGHAFAKAQPNTSGWSHDGMVKIKKVCRLYAYRPLVQQGV